VGPGFKKGERVMKKITLLLLSILLGYCFFTRAETRVNFDAIITPPATTDEKKNDPAPEDPRQFTQPRKPWTFFVYMAADNDLYPFAYRNLAQMKQIGSNQHCNIIVHLDIHSPDQSKVTKRLYIEQDKIWQIGPDYHMDSGSDTTLINALEWALNDFPSDHFALVLWNHGSGDLNPVMRKTLNPAQLFRYNAETSMIELDRSIGFIDFIEKMNDVPAKPCSRGICFDETNGTYLDDKKLMNAIRTILHERNGKKIDLVIFDACLMAGTGTAYMMSNFADYMTASEEVEMGTGYDYKLVLEPLNKGIMGPEDFARHIVNCYFAVYSKHTNDFTHSAMKLHEFENLNKNIDLLAQLLIEALHKQVKNSVKQVIKKSRSRQLCTSFDEPSYIDLHNFYTNLLQFCHQITLHTQQETNLTIQALKKVLSEGILLIKKLIIANVAGPKLAGASGISIYFPEYRIDSPSYQSYDATEFARQNHWAQLLHVYFNT
jgi:hypothetical protein